MVNSLPGMFSEVFATTIEECLHRLLGVVAPNLAGLDHRLNDGFGLLTRDVPEFDACVDQSLQCCFCHTTRLLALVRGRRETCRDRGEIGQVEVDHDVVVDVHFG